MSNLEEAVTSSWGRLGLDVGMLPLPEARIGTETRSVGRLTVVPLNAGHRTGRQIGQLKLRSPFRAVEAL